GAARYLEADAAVADLNVSVDSLREGVARLRGAGQDQAILPSRHRHPGRVKSGIVSAWANARVSP
ncbi:hypothetical protein, partial [Methyloparacoccus murrellii]